MKRLAGITIWTATLVLIATTGCALVDVEVAPTAAYQNNKYGYSIQPPKNWSTKTENDADLVIFRSPDEQMEINVIADSEVTLNRRYSEAKSRGVSVSGMTPMELVIRYNATEMEKTGASMKRIDWNERAVTVFSFIEGKDWQSWVKTHYVVDKGSFYQISLKAIGYSDSQFEAYRNQVNEIGKSFRIPGSTAIRLPEGKTIFDF